MGENITRWALMNSKVQVWALQRYKLNKPEKNPKKRGLYRHG
jgi:hypothetical protein